MRISKPVRIFIAWLLIMVLANSLMTFVFEPHAGSAEVMWTDFRKEKNLDTVFVGPSLCMQSFNPYIYNDLTGQSSFNMATVGQPMEATRAAVREALKEDSIHTVVLGIGFYDLGDTKSKNAEFAFYRGLRNASDHPVLTDLEFVLSPDHFGKEESINYLFPWVFNHTKYVKDNIKFKLAGKSMLDDGWLNGTNRTYIGKGFLSITAEIPDGADMNDTSWNIYPNHDFSDRTMGVLDDIIAMCQEKGVDLIVVNTPHPPYDVLSYGKNGEYFALEDRLSAYLAEKGVDYYNFSLLKPEYAVFDRSCFEDFEHVNDTGARRFTKAFVDVLQAKAAGQDVSEMFYHTESDYRASFVNPDALSFDMERVE